MPSLLDEDFLRKIDRLVLVSKRMRMGSLKGERRSVKRGTSVEFADYRNYTHGDDLRQVDWNIYARLEKVFIKLFEEEEELTVHMLLDCSRSMDWSGPDSEMLEGDNRANPTYNKLWYAKRVAAAISYMGLAAMDRVTISGLSALGNSNELRMPIIRGKNQTVRMIRFVEKLQAGGTEDLNTALRNYSSQIRYGGLVFLISDLLTPGGCFEGLRALQNAGFEVNVINVLSPDEINPVLRGDLKLVDIETGEFQEVSIDNKALEMYRQEFNLWQREIIDFCQRRAINYIQVDTTVPFDDLVLHYMRRRGLVA
ncbi:MAG: DUF58 domain-containing protein [Chloroflexi bacterium]|uniref:DUF58 domain-containing protein n=1 Tax=Candidatus Chlorohelix allophototropha TaxID=3003348 RepID=A0A8T7LVG4_9CHLR|nr:DUF58 domain-containing protein [Chloroflexota bacterium]WJW66755.1 DUF58 domain-containing protein [Chloroflexota bacterium L227-S17]